MDQELRIKFHGGTLRIKAGEKDYIKDSPKKFQTHNQSDKIVKVNGYEVRLINVPEVERPGLEPIEYCPYFENLNEIMLLENIKYHVLFESEEDKFELLPFIVSSGKSTFEKLNFELGDNIVAGFLDFKSYVGKTFLDIKTSLGRESIPVEVRSRKISYYDDYPRMLADLSDEISSLILEADSPTFQRFVVDSSKAKTFYEDFIILEYIFRPENLPSAAEYINRNFYTRLKREVDFVPVALASNIDIGELPRTVSEPTGISAEGEIRNLPQVCLEETPDTSENRFYKYFLESLEDLILKLLEDSPEGYIRDSLKFFLDEVDYQLSFDWLKDVGAVEYLPLNSQVLQKRDGYRDILRYFFILELSLRFAWKEFEESFRGFEKRLSELYEYWCYFKLIRILEDITGERVNPLDVFKIGKWRVKIRRGYESMLKFALKMPTDTIIIKLSYNRKFAGETRCRSYSLPFIPDYSILVDIDECTYFIHFDAKYRSKITRNFYNDSEIKERDLEEEYKRKYEAGDIYKMHTYKDAILHSIGAYILYPGNQKIVFKEDINEIPSIGAFPLNPNNRKNEEKLKKFIKTIIMETVGIRKEVIPQ
ncbi:MAG: DUF2357 domain-containing protein [Methanobacteriales archaeon]|nr:DUF2357 domain-containing protein [Methanobacteriales archaeon]